MQTGKEQSKKEAADFLLRDNPVDIRKHALFRRSTKGNYYDEALDHCYPSCGYRIVAEGNGSYNLKKM